MWGAGCNLANVCDDYTGAQFIWALRLAAQNAGHMRSADETHEFFADLGRHRGRLRRRVRLLHAARLRRHAAARSHRVTAIPTSVRDSAWYLASFDVADPTRVMTFGATDHAERWQPSPGT